MRHIYHLVSRASWNGGTGDYRAVSLDTEGFIHCSNEGQVVRIANLFCSGVPDLCAVVVDTDRLTSPVKDEDPGTGELFPHIYGPINRDAVVAVRRLERGPDGGWARLV